LPEKREDVKVIFVRLLNYPGSLPISKFKTQYPIFNTECSISKFKTQYPIFNTECPISKFKTQYPIFNTECSISKFKAEQPVNSLFEVPSKGKDSAFSDRIYALE